MKLTLVYFCVQTLLRLNLVLEQRPAWVEGLDTMLDGLLWDVGAWLIICLPVLVFMKLISKDKYQSWIPNLTFLTFFALGCLDFFWMNRIYVTGLNLFEAIFLIIGFTLFTSYAASKVSIKLPQFSQKPLLVATAVCTFGFVAFIGPWLDHHESVVKDDQIARSGVYEQIFH